MKSRTLLLTLLLGTTLLPGQAQRLQQPLGRGVVAVYGTSNGSAGVEVTWRRLAQEPEDAKYNVYVSKSPDGGFAKINTTPLTNTNFATTLTKLPYNSYVAVTLLDNGQEGELSKPFLFKNNGLRNIYMEIRYDKSPLAKERFTTKFVWPCDLNGDGEMDYVVDRCPVDGSRNYYIEGYLADGTFLWNVDLGVNEVPCDGQNDNLCAYDIDCDGRGELIVQTSDGTRLWDASKGTWGLYLLGKATADSDGDGIVDYDTQSTKNPPRYMTVIDGLTGQEKASAEFAYDDAYNRTNKASLMGEEYNKHEGHVGIFYYDGIHPAIVGEWHTRSADGNTHHYRNVAFAYVGGQWQLLFSKKTGGVVFHQIRIADVDGDGCDEMLSGEYAMDQDGSTLYNARIAHGDRHRISDIDPERPGLECFAIQQNAGDMLGQILYDAGTGEAIKKWYLSAVGDVGRGECMDVDKNHLGWEMWSTMDGVYDAKGDRIEGLTNVYPTEGMWWDGQLDREILQTSDSHYNFYFQDYGGGRLIEPAKESGYQLKTSYGKRGKFWGDIIGDWREELIVIREVNGVCQGIVGLTTDYKTSVNNIYCLQQDPHYRGDCTTRGYYQTPNPGFYLGYDMPRPQLPPCMVADAQNEVFDLTLGNGSITPDGSKKNIYVMPVKGQTLSMMSPLQLAQGTKLWKSQQGTLLLTAPLSPSAETEASSSPSLIISEGIVESASEISVPIDLRARGTLAGSPVVDAEVTFEGALNYEGCRLMPRGTMTFKQGLTLRNRVFLQMSLADRIVVEGDLKALGNAILNIQVGEGIEPGEYRLIEYTGSLTGFSKFTVDGLVGQKYRLENKDNAVCLIIEGQRQAQSGVTWSGAQNGVWDYQAENWTLNGSVTEFVAGDDVEFTDEATRRTVTFNELIPAGQVTVNSSNTYTFSGNGGLTGSASLVKKGSGSLVLNTVKSDYTGTTDIQEGSVTVKQLSDKGSESSLGSDGIIRLGRAKLIVNNSSTGTDRSIQLTDSATMQVASGTTALKGIVSGTGQLTKTGNGQLNINHSSNTWSGGTVLNAGTLAQGAWNALIGKVGSVISVTGNATFKMFDSNSSSTMPHTNYVFDIAEGKTLTLLAGSRCNINGSLRGEGTYKISFPYVRGDVSTNTSKFEGVYEVASSNCRFIQAMDLGKATLRLDEGSYAAGFKAGKGDEASYSHKVGTLTGTGTLGTGTWNIARLLVNYKTTRTTATCDKVSINGSAVLKNPVIEMQTTSTTAIPDNAEFQVLGGTGKRTVSGTVTIIPERPKEGWKWDTSRLASEGILTIVEDADAIQGIEADAEGTAYDLSGRKVVRQRAGQVYVVNGKKVKK